MPLVNIECPSCAWEGKIDEKHVGKKLKCSKCGQSFIAEVGGEYDLAKPDRPARVESSPPPSTSNDGQARPAKAKPKPEPKPADAEFEKLMDRWAED